MANLVIIEPIDPQSWGDLQVRGAIKGTNGHAIFKEDNYVKDGVNKVKARTIAISGTGVLLDMDDPEQVLVLKAIKEDKGVAPFFTPQPNGARGSKQRFTIKNISDDANSYLDSRERKVAVDTFIANISKDEQQLRKFGLIFGLKGQANIIKAALYKMAEDDQKRPELAKMSQHFDRVMIETIYTCLDAGNKNEKKGLWQDSRKMFYWYETPLAIGLDGTIAYFKDKKNEDLYKAMKESVKAHFEAK